MPKQSARLVLVNEIDFMLYTPFLPEAAAGTLEPRHVVTPLRDILKRTYLRIGSIVGHDPAAKTVSCGPSTARSRRCPTTSCCSRSARSRGRCRCRAWPSTRSGSRAWPTRSGCATTWSRRWRKRTRPKTPPAAKAADLRLRRRRLRRAGGAGRAAGLRRRRDGELPAGPPARDALGPGRGERPGPAGDRIELADYALRELRGRGIDIRLETTLEQVGPRARGSRPARRCRRAPWSGPPASPRSRSARARPAARRARPGPGRRPPAGRRAWTRSGRSATAPPRPTRAAASARRPPSTRSARARSRRATSPPSSASATPEPFEYRSEASFVNLGRYKAVAGSATAPSAASRPGGWPGATT